MTDFLSWSRRPHQQWVKSRQQSSHLKPHLLMLRISFETYLFLLGFYFNGKKVWLVSLFDRWNWAVWCISSIPNFITAIINRDKDCRSSYQAVACGRKSFPPLSCNLVSLWSKYHSRKQQSSGVSPQGRGWVVLKIMGSTPLEGNNDADQKSGRTLNAWPQWPSAYLKSNLFPTLGSVGLEL